MSRLLEMIVYSQLNFLPYLLLALYPFKNSYRFSCKATNLLIISICIIQCIFGMWAGIWSPEQAGLISAVSTMVYIIFYFIAVKDHIGKTLFTVLMLSNLSNFIVMASKFLESIFFYQNAVQPYRWTFSMIMLVMQMAVLLPFYYLFEKKYAETIQRNLAPIPWNIIWMIPLCFYFIWYFHLYASHEGALALAFKPTTILYLFIVNAGALVIYYIILILILETEKNMILSHQNHQLSLMNAQHQYLKEKIEETRRAKHDLRHHIILMNQYLQNNQLERLKEYLASYQKSLPDDSIVYFCEHPSINVLLSHFANEAKERNIEFICKIHLPEQLHIKEIDLSVLMGNLLENAIEACLKVEEERFIKVTANYDANSIFLTIDNSFNGVIVGDYLSTKPHSSGLGISSAKEIVASHNGTFMLTHDDHQFCVSIMIHQELENNI